MLTRRSALLGIGLHDLLVQLEQLRLWEREGIINGGDEATERLIKALPERIARLAGEASS